MAATSYFGFGYALPGLIAPASSDTVDLLSALRTYLLSLPALAGLADVYLRQSGPQPTYPFLVMTDINAYPQINTTSSYYEPTMIQCNVFAESEPDASSLGVAAFNALLPIPANPKLTFADGYEMTRLPGMHRIGLDPGLSSGGKPVWNYIFSYNWLIGRNP